MVLALQGFAQVTYNVGQTANLSVTEHSGSTYYWSVYSDVNTSIPADASSYQFTTPASGAATAIVFNTAGIYYTTVVEMNEGGCSAGRYIPVYILDNPNTVQFTSSSATLCYVDAVDGIPIPLLFNDQSGAAIGSAHYPIMVSYTIDNVAQTPQAITETDPNLSILATQLSGNGSADQTYSIELTGATDAQNQDLQALTGHNTYSLMLISQPSFSLAETSVQLNLNDVRAFVVNGGLSNFVYQWELTDPDGLSNFLTSVAGSSDIISFVKAGVYSLRVRAQASNNCWSDWQTVTITVIDNSPAGGATLAIADINLGWKNENISGNMLTNDLHANGSLALSVTVVPDAASGTLLSFNTSTGDYVFKPAAGYTGDAVFEYQLCETNDKGISVCSKSTVTIQVLESDLANPKPAATDKNFAVAAGSAINGNFLKGDISTNNQVLTVGTVTSSSLSGNFSSSANGNFNYQAGSGFLGSESFSYQACQTGACDWGTVNLYSWDESLDSQQLLAADQAFYNSGILSGQLDGNRRLDGETSYSYELVSNASNGTVVLNADGSFSYQPAAGKLGYFSDRFVYHISGNGYQSLATVYISSYIEAPALIVQNQFTVGFCSSVHLDASKSTGTGTLTYNWSPADYLSDASAASPVFTPGKSTTYTVTLTDALGNQTTRSVQVDVAPEPNIVTEAYVFVQDASKSLMLDATGSVGTNLVYAWSSAGSGVIVSGQTSATVEVKGAGKYYLDITDQYGCTDRDSVIVGIWVQAIDDEANVLVNTYVSINVLRNDIPQGDLDPSSVSIVVPPSNGVVKVQTDSVIVYTPNQNYIGQDNFVYRVCNYLKQCDEAMVLVIVNEESLFIPNAFSPNGDGYNDYFEIKGLARYSQVKLKIFNRWGNLVFESGNYGNNAGASGYWDGIANRGVRIGKGEVPAGTYFYILDLGQGSESLSGFIFIDR